MERASWPLAEKRGTISESGKKNEEQKGKLKSFRGFYWRRDRDLNPG